MQILGELGEHGILQVMVEGGPRTLSAFFEAGLVNRAVWYLAPAVAGASGPTGALAKLSTESIEQLRRGRFVSVRVVGEDVRVEVEF
jgi:diaminohydroxyphosphoribosylaminopyrimidine deaminase/5-amino-6-(5-phosphoribosylamino)uracil reductase